MRAARAHLDRELRGAIARARADAGRALSLRARKDATVDGELAVDAGRLRQTERAVASELSSRDDVVVLARDRDAADGARARAVDQRRADLREAGRDVRLARPDPQRRSRANPRIETAHRLEHVARALAA